MRISVRVPRPGSVRHRGVPDTPVPAGPLVGEPAGTDRERARRAGGQAGTGTCRDASAGVSSSTGDEWTES